MASSLDHLLDASAPPTTVRTPQLDRELAALVTDAEAAVPGRSRLRRRILIGGLATIGVLGVGATASATGMLPLPWFDNPAARTTQTTSTGATCDVAYRAKGIEDPKHPVDAATRAATVTAADAFLKKFDFSKIDVDEAVKQLPPRATVDSERGPAETVEQYETFAVQVELERRVDVYLSQHGLPAEAISVAAAISCESDVK